MKTFYLTRERALKAAEESGMEYTEGICDINRASFEHDCNNFNGCGEYQCFDTDTDTYAWLYDVTEKQIEALRGAMVEFGEGSILVRTPMEAADAAETIFRGSYNEVTLKDVDPEEWNTMLAKLDLQDCKVSKICYGVDSLFYPCYYSFCFAEDWSY